MSLSIDLDGKEYTKFIDARVERSLESVAGFFEFTAIPDEGEAIPLTEGSLITINVDGEKFLTGYIDSYQVNYSASKHEVKVRGRSKTADLVDCTAGVVKDYPTIKFEKLCNLICKNFDINVVNNVLSVRDSSYIMSCNVGDTAFSFLEKYAKKSQVLLTDNENGDLVITRASEVLSSLYLKNIVGKDDNNIKSADRKLDLSNLYYKYIGQSEMSPIDTTDAVLMKDLSDLVGISFDKLVRKTRVLEFYTEEYAGGDFKIEDRVDWEIGIRRARAFSYNCVVAGHSVNGEIWKPNVLYNVDDEFSSVKGAILCKKVVFNYDLKNGSTTTLSFTDKSAYTLEATKSSILEEYELG